MASELGVQTIQHTNGTDAITIDSSGRVLQPAKPSFHAYRDSSAAEGLTGTIVFNATKHNIGSHYDTSTGKFTAPVAGVYQFNFSGFGCENTSGHQLAANTSVFVDLHNETTSADLARIYYINASAGYPVLSMSHAVSVAANDVILIQVNQRYVYSDTSDLYLNFSGFLVG